MVDTSVPQSQLNFTELNMISKIIMVFLLKTFSISTMRLYRTSKDIKEYLNTSYKAELKGSSLGKVCISCVVSLI